MKKIITLVFLFQIGTGIAQNVAFTDEVTRSNGYFTLITIPLQDYYLVLKTMYLINVLAL